ncbi:hypothetical protein ACFL43_01050 [Thermodesulfobacteriota bacterium]
MFRYVPLYPRFASGDESAHAGKRGGVDATLFVYTVNRPVPFVREIVTIPGSRDLKK